MIEVKNLSFRYSSEPILENVNFSIARGDFTSIIGANGTGKSTLLKLLLKELAPVKGEIKLFDTEIQNFKGWHQIGYVPQNRILGGGSFPATAEEIVRANLFTEIGFMGFPKKIHQEKAKEALALVGLEGFEKRLIGNLSGGQQQRVMIARVLVSSPKLMLLDEPTTGIDAKTAQQLYELLTRLNQEMGLTIVMVTHDLARAASYVSRTLCLEEGSVVELEPEQIEYELAHRHKHPPISNHHHHEDSEKGGGGKL